MTWKQTTLIIAINAVVSTLITLLLVVVILPALNVETPVTTPMPTSSTAAQGTEPAVETTSTPSLQVHIVQAGDTISGLALLYDVPAEDIVAANNLENPNFLQVGTELVIPVGGVSQEQPTLTPVPTATDTPQPFEPPSAQTATAEAAAATAAALPSEMPAAGELQIEITEIIAAGDADREQVTILNNGTGRAVITGWSLSDAEGNVYTFPEIFLWPGGSVSMYTRIGQDSPPNVYYWNKLVPIWSSGETATLKNENGEVVFTFVVEP